VNGTIYVVHRTTIYLPDDLKANLERKAAETGRTEADIVRDGIRLALAQLTPPAPRSGLFDSEQSDLSQRVDELLRNNFGQVVDPR